MGVRVNCVAYGNIKGSSLGSAVADDSNRALAVRAPLRRLGLPEDVANAIVWLSSPLASYITGISLPVDGGFSLATGPP
jgi:NAD(P)-dependent dehydrogenase (short-subunit alcohol dehydrogenase family)